MAHALRQFAKTAAPLILFFLLATALLGQSGAGTVRGLVTDLSGATVPGTTVSVTGLAGLRKVAVTGKDSEYQIDGLPLGSYTMHATAKGFRLFEKADLVISSAQPQTLDIRLEVGIEKQ